MGSLCSRESNDNFHGQGRALGSAPPSQPNRSSVPARAGYGSTSRASTGQGRTLGGNGSSDQDKREAAAKAAEGRAKSSQSKGKLGQKLAEQKKQSRTNTLEEASRENRLVREADENARARNWD